jgi:hypothetical protein
VMFLQAAMVVVRRCSSFFNDPSAVPMVTAMASTTRVQLAATEGQAMGKELKAENKVVVEEVAKASSAPALAEMKALLMGSMEGGISQVTYTPPPPSSPRKCGRLLSPET